MTAAAVVKGTSPIVKWSELPPLMRPRGINIKWIGNEKAQAVPHWPGEWHIGGWKGGAEGAIITGPIKGMVHVPYQGIWHEPAYGPPRYERKVDKRREISTRVALFSDAEFGWFNTEERWWTGMDGDLPGHFTLFTQKYGELFCPMQLLEASETELESDPTDDDYNCQEWDILLAADGEPRWRQPDVRPPAWVNDLTTYRWIKRDDELLSPYVKVGVGKLRAANRGTEHSWPIYTVTAPGRCWLPNGLTGQMVRVPKLNKGEHVTIDTNPEHRIAISDKDPVRGPFKELVDNSELLSWLFGEFGESGKTILERFHGQGFDSPIPPEHCGDVAGLPQPDRRPGQRAAASTVRAGDLVITTETVNFTRCKCGHYKFMHRNDDGDCLNCNAPISQPQACENGTCCHAFRAVVT